jgi:hypothetical protein
MFVTREHPRFPVEQVTIVFQGDATGQGTVANLSIKGCQVEDADVAIEPHTYLSAYLHLPSSSLPVKVDSAAVRWATRTAFGLEFLVFKQASYEQLKAFIDSLGHTRVEPSPNG